MTSAAVRLRRLEQAPRLVEGVVAVISDALLPLYLWRSIPVRRRERVEMSALEQFVLEMAVEFGVTDAVEFEEITSLPGSLLPALSRRLVAGGVLNESATGYVPVAAAARSALTGQVLEQDRPGAMDFVLLPRTGDLIALPSRAGSWPFAIERARPEPVLTAPVSEDLVSVRRTAYLSRRFEEGSVSSMPPDIVAIEPAGEDDPPLLPKEGCPTYRCRGTVRQGRDGYRIDVVLAVPSRRTRGTQDGEPLTVDLTGAEGLVAAWLDVAGAPGRTDQRSALWSAVAADHVSGLPPPRVERVGPTTWRLWIDARAARALSSRRSNLALPVGIAVETAEATAEILVEFAGADPESVARIAVDQAITAALEAGSKADRLQTELARTPEPPPRLADLRSHEFVLQRIWELGHYALAYEVREAEDFIHD